MDNLIIAEHEFDSRLFLGTGKFSSNQKMKMAIEASQSNMITLAMRRVDMNNCNDNMLEHIKSDNLILLPNTSGVRTAKEAVFAALLAREALETNWLKLEIHPDQKYLLPDSIETLKACEELAKQGFNVLPYMQADPIIARQLENAGAVALMPLGSVIGSNRGLLTKSFIEIIIEQAKVPVIVDAGIGAPSHAAEAMEMGADAVLVNTAIATAQDPVAMANAFRMAVAAGRLAYLAKLPKTNINAKATSPLTEFLNL